MNICGFARFEHYATARDARDRERYRLPGLNFGAGGEAYDRHKICTGLHNSEAAIRRYITYLLDQGANISGHVARQNQAEGNIRECADVIGNHNGTTSGGGTQYKFRNPNNTIFHISHGHRENDDGCSVFFAPFERPGGAADRTVKGTILAIGRHRSSNGDIYDFAWKNPYWTYAETSINLKTGRGNTTLLPDAHRAQSR